MLDAAQVNAHFIAAVKAAAARARELGDEIARLTRIDPPPCSTPRSRFLIDVVFGLFTYALLLRLVMQLMRAPFRNPLGQAVMALTDWIVKPLRKVLPGCRRRRLGVAVAAYLFQFAWLLALYLRVRQRVRAARAGASRSWRSPRVIALVKALLWLTIIVVFAQAILSWVAPDGPLAGVLNALTFPLLRPVRRLVPPIGGTLDLSPLIVIVVAQLVLITLVPWLEATARASCCDRSTASVALGGRQRVREPHEIGDRERLAARPRDRCPQRAAPPRRRAPASALRSVLRR